MRRWTSPLCISANSEYFSTAKIQPSASANCRLQRKWTAPSCSRWQQKRTCAGERTNICLAQPAGCQLKTAHYDLHSPDSLDRQLDERLWILLGKAAAYSIPDIASLAFEASVDSTDGRDRRLVDNREFQFDYGLWEILLQYRIYSQGDHGVKAVWKFLTRRDRVRLLPEHWPTQNSLWSVFIDLGLRDHDFLAQIGKHAQQLWRQRKLRRSTLFVEVVGGLLKSVHSSLAPAYSQSMHPGLPITSSELQELFTAACSSAQPHAFNHFRSICNMVQGHSIYGSVISLLCEERQITQAITMHSYLISRRDLPSSFGEIEPLVRQIADHGLDLALCTRQLNEAGLSFDGQAYTVHSSVSKARLGLTRETLDLATARTFGVKRTKISDAFAARFFATKALSFNFALNGLHMLGLEELGPLSLREIALQSGTVEILQQRLSQIDAMKIDTGGSAYSRLIRRLIRDREDILLMDVVRSDQHPEVFEDRKLQLELLAQYHWSKDWPQANRTLAVLANLGSSRHQASNFLLSNALLRNDLPEVTKIITRMNGQHCSISRSNMIQVYRRILSPRSPKSEVSADVSPALRFFVQLRGSWVVSGTQVPAYSWRDPLRRLGKLSKRLGMASQWKDLEKICLWLGSLYSPRGFSLTQYFHCAEPSVLPVEAAGRRVRQKSTLNDVFTPSLQRALVEWGFMAGSKSEHSNPTVTMKYSDHGIARHNHPFVSGIELLVDMRRRYGLRLDRDAIQRGCEERLRQLFSRGGHSRLLHNREARRKNGLKILAYMRLINRAYGETLLIIRDPAIMSRILEPRPVRPQGSHRPWRWSKLPLKKRGEISTDGELRCRNSKTASGDDFVMYRDIFHASWEDYQPQGLQT